MFKEISICDQQNIVAKSQGCRVILKDIKHHFGRNHLKLFDEISLNYNNSIEKWKNICKICNKKLSRKTDLKEHIRKIHSTDFDCKICNQKFVSKYNLDFHITEKHPGRQKNQFQCDFVGKKFKSRNILYHQMKTHLSMVKCELCDKILKPYYIHAHLISFHATGQKFQYKICSKSFKSAVCLYNHQRTYNKTQKCDICIKMLTFAWQLKQHNKEIHENSRSFECEIFWLKFNQKEILRNHQKTHDKNRSKPFTCQRCDFITRNTSLDINNLMT